MAKKENAGTEAYRPDPNRETILMADKANGRLDVISEFRRDPNDNNRISVVTVTPETKNRASYYTLMFGSDAAKAISDLRYQDFVNHRDNPESQTVEREFFLCPVERVLEVINAHCALRHETNDEISAAILSECRTSPNQLDKLRYSLYDIPWGELASIGIDRNQLSAQDLQRLREGGETPSLFDVVYKVGQDTQISANKCSLQMYRDLDDRPRLDIRGPLPHPEYKDEKYKMHISADDEARIAYGRALPRAIMVDNHGKQEWCYAGFRTDTNRMITVPVRAVAKPEFIYGNRISQTQQNELALGRGIRLEHCKLRDKDNEFSSVFQFDVTRMDFVPINPSYAKPYIPPRIAEQLTEQQIEALKRYEEIDARNVKSSTGRSLSIMGIDRSTNAPYYSRINRSQEQNKEQEQAKAQEQTAERQQAVFEEKTRSQGMSV